jgi:hypothetical protein
MIRIRALAVSLALAIASPAAAQAGSGQLTGHGALAVRGCGRQRFSFTATVATAADATWNGQDSDGNRFGGTWTPKGTKGKKLDLAFDAESEGAFVATILSNITERCETPGPIVVSAVTRKIFRITLNRKGTRATLVLRYTVRGSAGGRSGTARYGLTAKGPWTAAAAALPSGSARTEERESRAS